MDTKKEHLIYWTPRILSLLFILFLSLFSLDVFGEYKGLAIIIPLAMHLLPSFALLVVAMIAWKYDIVGVIVFLLFALWYTWTVASSGHLFWSLPIAGPAFLVSILFFLNWLTKRKNGAKI